MVQGSGVLTRVYGSGFWSVDQPPGGEGLHVRGVNVRAYAKGGEQLQALEGCS